MARMQDGRLATLNRPLGLGGWVAISCIVLAWAATILSAAFDGYVRWWTWVNLAGSSSMIAAFVLWRRRSQMNIVLLLIAAALTLLAAVGQVSSLL